MEKTVAVEMLDILDAVKSDPEYQSLVLEYESCSESLRRQLKTMNQPQHDAVMDYCGLLVELHIKILEYTLSHGIKQPQSP